MKKLILSSIALLAVTFMMAGNAVAQTKLDRSKQPVGGPQPKVQIGKIETFTLENGLKVFVVENHKLPRVSYSMQFNIAPFTQGNAKGYTDLMATLLGTATRTRSKDQINNETDMIGATLSASSEGIYASSLKKHNDKLLDLMSDVLLNPVFKQEELDKAKTQMLSGLQAEQNNPDAMAGNISRILNYGAGHPYGEIMTEATLNEVKLQHVIDYYNTYFIPNVAYLAIVGDITLDEARKLTEKHFGSWRKGNVMPEPLPEITFPTSTQLYVVPRSNSVQSSVRITYPIKLRTGDPDAIKVRVMSEILGGGSSARLFMNLREKYNLTYGAYCEVGLDEYIGYFEANAEVRASGTDSSVVEFLREMNRLRTEKVSQEELQGVINNMSGKFAIALENPSTVARFAINIDKYGLPKDYYHNYLTELSKVTVEDVYQMAQKYIRPENAWIVVVGERSRMQDLITKWKEKNAIHFVDQYNHPIIETRPAPAGITAEMVWDNYIKAQGGAENLMKVKSKVTTMKSSIQGMELTIVSKEQYPKKKGLVKSASSTSIAGMGKIQNTVFDGTNSYTESMQGNKKLEGEDLAEAKRKATPYFDLRMKELGYKMTLVGIDVIEGSDAYKLEITGPNGKSEFQWFDVKSGLLVKTETTTDGPEGPATIAVYYGDYKAVNGVMYPHKIRQDMGQMVLDMTVVTIEINTKIDAADFVIKESK